MCTFDTSVSVWTHRTDREWLDHNGGCTDVLLVMNISHNAAVILVERLAETYGDTTLEIRNVHNVCLWANTPELIGTNRDARNREPQS